SRRALMAPLVSAGLVFAGLMVYLTSAPFYFIEELGVGERGFAAAQFGTVLFYIAGLVLTPRLSARFGATPVIAGGFAATAIGGLGMAATALILPAGVLAFVAPFALFAFGIGLAMAPLITEALSADRNATGAVAAVIGVVTIGCA